MMGAYQAPEVQVLDVNIEGVLCGSPTGGNLDVDPWETGNAPW